MKEEARRLTRETTSRGEDKVGCYQEVWDVGGVDFARDSGVVAGWAVVFENGAAIRGNPELVDAVGLAVIGGVASAMKR